jgi:hypothetical protein
MDLLKVYNSNLYIKICSLLNNELDRINTFIFNIRNKKEYSKLLNLDQVYKEIFANPVFNGCIEARIERVLNPHYSIFQGIKPESGNSTFFISIKLISDNLVEIDLIYGKQLTSLIRLFKNIFSVIDKPSYTIQEDDLIKYEHLIKEINQKMNHFLFCSDNKQLIQKREKLTSNIINNLPHKGFYHMTHFDNLESILSNGLMSHKRVNVYKLIRKDISNQKLQKKRDRIEKVFGKNIQDYVPLYINPQNPMMGSEKVKNYGSNIVLLEVIPHILVQEENTLFSDGNAAQRETKIYHNQNEMENINWQLLQEGKWKIGTESHRVMCSEVLVPEIVEVFYINKIILRDTLILKNVMMLFPNHKGIVIEISEKFFSTTRLN